MGGLFVGGECGSRQTEWPMLCNLFFGKKRIVDRSQGGVSMGDGSFTLGQHMHNILD